MADTARTAEIISAEDYLAREDASPVRHEYVSGLLYAMVGTTDRHNRISLNLATALTAYLPDRCTAYMSDLKVRIKRDQAESYYYPDCMVCCGPSDQSRVWRDDPIVLGEVLSPSTERIDRHEKLNAYTQIETLQEYLLIDQGTKRVELFRRADEWQREVLVAGDTLHLASIGFSVPVDALYRRVEF